MFNKEAKFSARRKVMITSALLFGSVIPPVGPGAIPPEPAVAFVQECRPLSSLNIQGQILSGAVARRVGLGPWRLTLTINTNRHVMLCNYDFYCTTQGIDKCAFRPPLSFNINSVEVVDATCQVIWDITPISNSADVGFGFKIKYQEDVVGSGGSGINPKRKTATLTIRANNYVSDTDLDLMDTLVEQADDGS